MRSVFFSDVTTSRPMLHSPTAAICLTFVSAHLRGNGRKTDARLSLLVTKEVASLRGQHRIEWKVAGMRWKLGVKQPTAREDGRRSG